MSLRPSDFLWTRLWPRRRVGAARPASFKASVAVTDHDTQAVSNVRNDQVRLASGQTPFGSIVLREAEI